MLTILLRHRRDQIPKDVGSENLSRNDYNKIKTLPKQYKGVSASEKKKKKEKRKSQKKKKKKKEKRKKKTQKKKKIGRGPFNVPKGRMRKNPGIPGKKEAVEGRQPAQMWLSVECYECRRV